MASSASENSVVDMTIDLVVGSLRPTFMTGTAPSGTPPCVIGPVKVRGIRLGSCDMLSPSRMLKLLIREPMLLRSASF